MKAITIGQPYAHMIIVTREKRVENRTWCTHYRGDILIHAGKSKAWLCGWPHVELWDEGNKAATVRIEDKAGDLVVFGAVIGIARIIDCVHIDGIRTGLYDQQYPWLRDHAHVEGPWCWVLADMVLPLPNPLPMRGKLGLFEVSLSA